MHESPVQNTMGRRRLLALGAMSVALSACGGTGGGGGGGQKLKASTYITPSYDDLFPGMKLLLKNAKKETHGDISFEMFHSGTLLDAEQAVPGLLQGSADLIFQTSSYISSTYPILGVAQLPFLQGDIQQMERALAVDGKLYKLINKQLGAKNLRLLASMPTSLEWLWTRKPIRSPEDMHGMRIRTAGEVEGETVKALGASPVSMSSAEIYQALQRGTIDGMISYLGTVISRDLQKVLRYGTAARFGDYSVDAYVRKDWFDGLDSSLQDALLAAGRAYNKQGTATQVKVHKQDYLPKVKKAGIKLIEPKGADLQAFEDAVSGVQDWWRKQVGDQKTAERALKAVETA
ncbi:MAG: TRAP transporter substrate-binding protein [Streptosporangiales bacterium]